MLLKDMDVVTLFREQSGHIEPTRAGADDEDLHMGKMERRT
jgi:hypothetical protein